MISADFNNEGTSRLRAVSLFTDFTVFQNLSESLYDFEAL